ncbi:unnamed protein product [Arabidopsis thaliana]|uniref:(thale cress) hypothetical protein n=1 Tax=Arabidopsis thaliana TaxID=3702 RepID=A0A7G2DZ18_ARATH|nr:unnamed protein product [Arabidopsis thaliana]
MFHQGGRSIEALLSFLPKENIWDVEGRVRGVSLNDSRFQFFFETEADLKKVLNKRPCHFGKWSFALERWEPNLGAAFPNSMTFWTRTEGIPPEFWEEQILTINTIRGPLPLLSVIKFPVTHISLGPPTLQDVLLDPVMLKRELLRMGKNVDLRNPFPKIRMLNPLIKIVITIPVLNLPLHIVPSQARKFIPALVRERLFRLNLSKKAILSDEDKGKEIDLPRHSPVISSETGSSANKSLTFDSLNPREDEPISATNLGSMPLCSQLEKRKSWYEMTLEEEAEDQDEDEDTPEENPESEPANSLAVKFSKSINFTSPANLSILPVTITATHDAEVGWVDNHHLMSEALNLDWTVEDDEAYHALEPSLPGDTEDFDVENDDLLGEDL